MKKKACYIIIFALAACTGGKQKSAVVRSQHMQERIDSLRKIEEIGAYFFHKQFNEIEKDTAFKGRYEIKKSFIEEEGVEWDSYDFVKDHNVVFTIENNWQSRKKVHRITFFNSEINTSSGISANSKFREVKKQIDTSSIPNMPDGFLSFFDKKLPCMYYCFEDTNNEYLSKGVAGVHNLPDSLEIYSIILMDCNF